MKRDAEDYRPTLGIDTTSTNGRNFEVDGGYWEQQVSDYMIRAVVVELYQDQKVD